MSEVMDIMMKIGVTEKVTNVFESLSNLMKHAHDQAERLEGQFEGLCSRGFVKFAGPKTRRRRA